MKSEIVDVNETRRDLTIEVPSTVVDEAIGHAAAKLGRSAQHPRLPPGQGARDRDPPALQAADHAGRRRAPRARRPSATRWSKKASSRSRTPDIKDLVLEEGKPLTFKASFDVVPSFDPGDLSTIEATEPSRAIEDEAVNQSLERMRERNARFEAVESGVVEAGHTVVVGLERQRHRQRGQARASSTSTSRSASSSARRRTRRASTPK